MSSISNMANLTNRKEIVSVNKHLQSFQHNMTDIKDKRIEKFNSWMV